MPLFSRKETTAPKQTKSVESEVKDGRSASKNSSRGFQEISRAITLKKQPMTQVFVSHRTDQKNAADDPSKAWIKGVGVKTTVNTSFKINKNANRGQKEKQASESISSRSKDIDQPSANLAAGVTKLLGDDAFKDIPIEEFKLELGDVPLNISTGNYTITFFGKVTTARPPQVKGTSKVAKPESTASKVSKNVTEAVPKTNNGTTVAEAVLVNGTTKSEGA